MFGFGKKQSTPVQQLTEADLPFTDQQFADLAALPTENDMVRLGDITMRILGHQVQYISYYFGGVANAVNLTADLRVIEDAPSYHQYYIHKDDALTFLRRLNAITPRYFN